METDTSNLKAGDVIGIVQGNALVRAIYLETNTYGKIRARYRGNAVLVGGFETWPPPGEPEAAPPPVFPVSKRVPLSPSAPRPSLPAAMRQRGAEAVAGARTSSRFSVNVRFGFIRSLINMVILGDANAVVICGTGGVGKTYEVLASFAAAGLLSIEDYEEASFHEREAFEIP